MTSGLTIANSYGPNADDPIFCNDILQKIENIPNDYSIVGGDFNFVCDVFVDTNGKPETNIRIKDAVCNWM